MNGAGHVNSVGSAIKMASSSNWIARAEAVRLLADHIADPRAQAQLVSSMDDADTAVIAEAVEVLVRAGGIAGIGEVPKHLATSEADVGHHIRDKLIEIWMDGYPVLDGIRTIKEVDPSGYAHDGAMEMLDLLKST